VTSRSRLAVHDHAVPRMEPVVIERLGQGEIQGDHHLGDPGLRGADAAPITGETELSPDRRLDAVAVEHLSLDCRGVQCLVTHDVHDEGFEPPRNCDRAALLARGLCPPPVSSRVSSTLVKTPSFCPVTRAFRHSTALTAGMLRFLPELSRSRHTGV